MAIQILAEEVVAQIAAGEVVERPAAVVKELVENSLDAGATYVRVSILGDGRRKIQISDNGSGIPSEEIELAFARHATSKLRDADDLYRIETLGFRGEALASIASVSQLAITTRHENDSSGTLLRLEGGQIRQKRSVGAPRGTTITVENLFYNTPARLKFLKSENTERRQIATIITRYAMAYPFVRFEMEQDGREAFRTHGSGQLLDVMMNALGLDQIKNMFEVNDSYLNIHVRGYTSAPSYNRSDRSRITLFVNGRWIQDTSLTYAVIQAYHTLLMTGRFPVAVLLINVAPEDVDVNVHPTKAEVRFRDSDAVFSAVQRAVRRAVIDQAQTPTLRGRLANGGADRVWNPAADPVQIDLSLPLQDTGQPAVRQHDNTPVSYETDETAIPEGPQGPTRPRTLPMLRVVGQVGASYIIAEGPAGLYLIDQHAAHERVLYEQFMAEHAQKETVSQYTLAAQTIQVAPPEARLLEENLDALSELGFEIEPFGPNVFVIRGVPAILADSDPVETMAGILDDLVQGNKPGQQAVEDRIVLRVCKQAAIKAGQVLSLEQMQALIRQLERCNSPLTCPHGRPTMIHMSSDQLAREFGRMG
jgi:DNA mismatch repair protein MutL